MIEKLRNLNPKFKQYGIVGGLVVVGLGLMWLLNSDAGSDKVRNAVDRDPIRNILTDRDTRDVSIDNLAAQVKRLQQQNDAQSRTLDTLGRRNDGNGGDKEIQSLRKELQNLKADILSMGSTMPLDDGNLEDPSAAENVARGEWRPGDTRSSNQRPSSSASTASSSINSSRNEDNRIPDRVVNEPKPLDPKSIFTVAPTPPRPTNLGPAIESVGEEEEGEKATSSGGGLTITSTSETVDVQEQAGDDAEDSESAYIPAGSILTGVMLNGMDAPTNQGARRDPFPSTIRIQEDAILPNRFRADVKECFLIVSGYGDMSSERAYLRGETISCVREDGGVIEARLDSYAVGEDGKAGVRGRLVSKEGAMIARTMLAGFMSGAAEAFDVNPIPVIQTGGSVGNNTSYQTNYSPSMFQGAAAQGASSALDRVAEFYIELAEGMYPVIEVDAGRQIELIMTKGTQLKIR